MATVALHVPLGDTGFGAFGFHLSRELAPLLSARGVEARVASAWPDRRLAIAPDSPDPSVRALHAALQRPPAGTEDVALSMFSATYVRAYAGRVRIGYTMWEGSRVPPAFAESLRPFHLVGVPTDWHKRALDATLEGIAPGPKPGTAVWPGAAPDAAFRAAPPSRHRADGFTFGNVGKYERRKGIAPLVAAYAEVALAHRGRPMRLLANWLNHWEPEWTTRARRLLARHGFDPEPGDAGGEFARFRHRDARDASVELLMRPLATEEDVLELHRACDAGIYPYFCEGWGLPLIETMACGVPCAATTWSAPTEYLADGIFVPIADTVERPMVGPFYEAGPWGTWREPTHEAIVRAMATLLDMAPARRLAMGVAAKAHLQQHFTWRTAASRVAADLNAILAALR